MGRPGLPICQTMLLRTEISTSKPQLQSRRLWPTLPRLKPRPKLMPTQHQLPQLLKPQLPKKPPQLSSNFTEEEHLLKRELKNLNPNQNQDQTPAQPTAPHQDLDPTQTEHPMKNCIEEKLTFSDREFVFKEFK